MLITKQEKNVQTDHWEATGGTEGWGSFRPIVELFSSGWKGLHTIYILTLPPGNSCRFHHPACRWETQSKNMNSKVISSHACKFHRDIVRALVVKAFLPWSKMHSKIKAKHGLFHFKQIQGIIDLKFIFIINCRYDVRAIQTPQMMLGKEKKYLGSTSVIFLMERILDQKSSDFWYILIKRLSESYLVFLSLRFSTIKWEQ